MIDQIRLALAALHSAGKVPNDGLRTVPVGAAWVGLDDQRRPHLLLATTAPADLPPPLDAVGITTRALTVEGRLRNLVDVVCLTPSLNEVFELFCAAILTRLGSSHTHPGQVLAAVLNQWQHFLHTTTGPQPGREQVAGLIGELLVLLDLANCNSTVALSTWAADRDHSRHDFRGGRHAMEVKTTQASSGHHATIHGTAQMEPPKDGTLHLHLVRLEAAPGTGTSIPALLDQIIAAGVEPKALYTHLGQAGLPADRVGPTSQLTFQLRERTTLPVDADTPRIVDASFTAGALPAGVLTLTYRVDLAGQMHRALDDAHTDQLLTTLLDAALGQP